MVEGHTTSQRKKSQVMPLRTPSERRSSGSSRPTISTRSSRRPFNSTPDEDNEVMQLSLQIDEEQRYSDTILWSVGVLQHSVDDLEKQLQDLQEDKGFSDLDSEYKLRTLTQQNLNKKYEEQIEWYETELDIMSSRLQKGSDIAYDDDLDQYTEMELLHMSQALEKERNILASDLKTNGWLLDSHSKKYYHHKEVAEAYRSDLNFVNRSLEDFWKQFNLRKTTRKNSNFTPVSSPGSLDWSGASGILPSQRILDPRKGPVNKIAGVRSLPRLDFAEIDAHKLAMKNRKARSKLRGGPKRRAASLDSRRKTSQGTSRQTVRHHSLVETRQVEITSDYKESSSRDTEEESSSREKTPSSRTESIKLTDESGHKETSV